MKRDNALQLVPSLGLVMDILKKVWILESLSRDDLAHILRDNIKGTEFGIPTSLQLWDAYRGLLAQGMTRHEGLERAIRIKDVRTDSGVAPITVLTKPFPCPGRCVYCPTEARMPKSYISSEPAAARALSLEFDPYEQVRQRVMTLERNGHQVNKIELIVKGGTWSAYTKEYREWFIARCFQAANELNGYDAMDPVDQRGSHIGHDQTEKEADGSPDLQREQSINETAAYRIIGLTIETRPDWIKPKEIINLRRLGVTRVELGLQIINDRVLALTNRGTTVADAEHAIALLKCAGFKVDVHIMPGQPGATTEDDLASFRVLFSDPRFKPDMIKIYPCVVLPESELAEWTARGEFKPVEGETLREMLIEMQAMIPRYCRVSRMIRDFPTSQITHGNKKSNLREELDTEMKNRGIRCVCLRCREVGHVAGDHTKDKTRVFEERYENAGGTEVFLSVEDEDRSAVFGFCRLRLPSSPAPSRLEKGAVVLIYEAFPVLRDAAIIRELHTYGTALNVNQQKAEASQHKGYGRLLMQKAEEIARDSGCGTIAVISGIGVREYYRTLGYEERDTYMTKKLD